MPDRIAFRNRAHEVSRLEAFSDVIFGFAISLLVVSLEAPKNYEELIEMMRGFLPFAICFFLFIDCWFEHHHFFKRYALQDNTTIVLNTALLFVVLFYVYPLKFMFTTMIRGLLHQETGGVTPARMPTLFTIYGLGFAAVFLVLTAMYTHAWRRRGALQLNEVERIDTLESIFDNLCTGMFGIISTLLANTSAGLRWAGLVYFLLVVPKTLVPSVMGHKRRRAEVRMRAERDVEVAGVPSPA